MHYDDNHRRFATRRVLLAGILAQGVGLCGWGSVVGAPPFPKNPLDWPAVQQITLRTLAVRNGYRPGDLIARGDVEQVANQLKVAGWEIPDLARLLPLTLDSGSFLVRELRTPAGLAYSRAVAQQPIPFDRLDRLSREPGGQKLVHTMIHLPDGVKLMEPKPTPGFKDLTTLLPNQANGRPPRVKDFDKPTGRIYTEKQLVEELKRRWDASTAVKVSVPGRK